MKRLGKNGKKWLATRRDFLSHNPPNHQGYYVCYLCGIWVPQNEITIDHIVSRSRAPELRFVFSNLAVCCSSCNEAKGSRSVKILKQELYEDDELEGLW